MKSDYTAEIERHEKIIKDLRTEICQEYLKNIVSPGWKEQLYDIVKNRINNPKQKSTFRPAYNKIIELGIENYSIENMDMTFINELMSMKDIVSPHEEIVKSFKPLKTDRNLDGHISKESTEELYLRLIIALIQLKDFVIAVAGYDDKMSEESKNAFRNKYLPQVKKLKDKLDKQRIILIERSEEIEADIESILTNGSTEKAWKNYLKKYELFLDKNNRLGYDPSRYKEFVIAASNAGIPHAHSYAMKLFSKNTKEYKMYRERHRSFMIPKIKTVVQTGIETVQTGIMIYDTIKGE